MICWQKLLVGYKKGIGIYCTCCNSEVSWFILIIMCARNVYFLLESFLSGYMFYRILCVPEINLVGIFWTGQPLTVWSSCRLGITTQAVSICSTHLCGWGHVVLSPQWSCSWCTSESKSIVSLFANWHDSGKTSMGWVHA